VLTAAIVVAFELVGLAVIRWRFFETGFAKSLLNFVVGGAIIAVVGALVGSAG
jgi:erythrin-vacuolar iron transport family protein